MSSGTTRSKRIVLRIAYATVIAACAMLPWVSPADEHVAGKLTFTDSEINAMPSHRCASAPYEMPLRQGCEA